MTGSKKEFRSSLLLLVTAVIWGVAFVAQRVAMDYIGPFTFNGVRFFLGAAALTPVIYFFEKKKTSIDSTKNEEHKNKLKTTFLYGGICGLILFAAASMQQIGVDITMSAGRAAFITGLYIVLTPIFGIALKKKTAPFIWYGAVISCAGLYYLSGSATGNPDINGINAGDGLLLAGAVFWALHILWIDRCGEKIYPLRFAVIQFMVCSVLSLITAFIFEDVKMRSILAGYSPILYSALLSVGVAYTFQIIGQRNVGPAKSAIIFSTEALFAAVSGAIMLSERMEMRGYLGCLLIFIGIICSQLRIKLPFYQK
ncbi:MAG: DMT family transporter [Defluviitaleaceae bacterium]|nr:DMT family transporter [Defluviitaleaceae bacterium]